MMHIRVATGQDSEDVQQVHLCAFSENERQIVSTLAVELLKKETNPNTISLVAEIDGTIVGHVAFSPLTINNNKSWSGYILSPLGVRPDYQKRQIGSNLVKSGLERLSAISVDVVFVYGDPQYYSRFGFSTEAASKYSPPYGLEYPSGWQAIVFNKSVSIAESVELFCVASLSDPTLW